MHLARDRESRQAHFHCIHNDLPPKTHNYTMKGMYAAVIWIALWAIIITTVVGAHNRARYRPAQVGTAIPVR
ncbi:MAG TPA: hypothetical protein VFS19_05925 [Planctomycetota bacterium]|nr:hypothetical protein [Planctomycetota bacterium]